MPVKVKTSVILREKYSNALDFTLWSYFIRCLCISPDSVRDSVGLQFFLSHWLCFMNYKSACASHPSTFSPHLPLEDWVMFTACISQGSPGKQYLEEVWWRRGVVCTLKNCFM